MVADRFLEIVRKGRTMRMSKVVLRGLLTASFLNSFTGGAATADTPREIAKQVSPSVVLLVMEDANGQPLTMGSGFVVREGVVATSMHVIEGAASGYAKLVDEKAVAFR